MPGPEHEHDREEWRDLADVVCHVVQRNWIPAFLNSVSGRLVALISLKPRVYLLKNHDPVGPSASRSAGFPLWSVLFGRTDFHAMTSIPELTLSSSKMASYDMLACNMCQALRSGAITTWWRATRYSWWVPDCLLILVVHWYAFNSSDMSGSREEIFVLCLCA
jgi:hypothetical protein